MRGGGAVGSDDEDGTRSFFYATASFSSPELSDILCRTTVVSHVFSRGCCSALRPHGLSLARSSRRTAAPRSPEPQRRRIDFLPLGFAHSSRAKKVSPSPSSAALRPASGCVVDRLRPTIAIEATMVAGSKPARRSDMANIGTFKKVGNEFQG